MSNLEKKKIFVGNLPVDTTNAEIVELLEKLEPCIYVHHIFTFKNKSPNNSISAIVTVDSMDERDALINSFRSEGKRVHFKNKRNEENDFYLDYCHCQKDKDDKNQSLYLDKGNQHNKDCLLYTSPSPRDS